MGNPRRHTVLIVDDQPDIRMLIRLTFSDTLHDIREAGDGETALARCDERMPDVVLLDVMLPGIDGYEVCRRLKCDPRAADTFVLLMTAGDQETERAKARAAGADLYLPKPFSPSQLAEIVATRLASRPA